ncbi:MAG: PDZ domain-containing protein [Xanthomonadales bacterium]|nr:PDZ domain-containing protein [Xanthomonadales bacterium]
MRTRFMTPALVLLLAGGQAHARETDDSMPEPEMRAEYQAVVEAARAEQEEARAALEKARGEIERARLAEERAQNTEERARARDVEAAERAAMREELSRVHEELRRASREVARLHREIAREARDVAFAPRAGVPGVGDKAVIGVVLGEATARGVPVLGVSPDGPSDRAGIQQGDLIVAMMGEDLAGSAEGDARAVLGKAMDGVKIGDELVITVERDGQRSDLTVKAERREPFAWQSIIRLPSAPAAPAAPGAPPAVPRAFEHIEIPEIDREELHGRMDQLREEVERARVIIDVHRDGEVGEFHDSYAYEFDTFSDFGDDALAEANVWFGLPVTRGLKLAEMDSDLAGYFKADGGVLVLKARPGNDLQLKSGDVIQQIGAQSVSKPSDVMRALREWEPGASIEIRILRDRKDQTLDVVLPERHLGQHFVPFPDQDWNSFTTDSH